MTQKQNEQEQGYQSAAGYDAATAQAQGAFLGGQPDAAAAEGQKDAFAQESSGQETASAPALSITKEDIARINELYRKSQTPGGLSPEEREEQASLRSAYIEAVRANLRGQLNNIDVKEPDGSITHLGRKFGNRQF